MPHIQRIRAEKVEHKPAREHLTASHREPDSVQRDSFIGRSPARAREPTQGHRKPGKLARVDRDTSPGRNATKGTQSPRASPGR